MSETFYGPGSSTKDRRGRPCRFVSYYSLLEIHVQTRGAADRAGD